jgi:thymidylate kinase
MTTHIFCLEGPQGTGKTTIIKLFDRLGYATIKEKFVSLDFGKLPSNSMTTQLFCMASHVKKMTEEANMSTMIFADRSPVSSVIYEGNLARMDLKMKIFEVFKEELEKIDIKLYSVYLKLSKKETWKRVQARLNDYKRYNKKRLSLDEHDKKKFCLIYSKYKKMKWDVVIPIDDLMPYEVADKIRGECEKIMSKK